MCFVGSQSGIAYEWRKNIKITRWEDLFPHPKVSINQINSLLAILAR